jgi:hypothetical protein
MNRQAESFEGTEAKTQVADNSKSTSNLDSVRASAFGPPDRTPPGQNSEKQATVSQEEVRAHFQKQMELTIIDMTSVGPVKRGQGYFQALKDRFPDMKDEDASKEARRIKKLSDSRDVLKVGEMLPTASPEQRKEMLDKMMKGWDAATASLNAHIEKAAQERAAAEKAEQEKAAAEKAEQEKAAAEKVEQEKAAAEKAEQEKAAAEKAEQEKAAAEKAEQEKAAAEKAEQEKAIAAAEKAEQEKATAAAEKAEQERAAQERKLDDEDEKPTATPDFDKLNVNPQGAVPKLPDSPPTDQPSKEQATKEQLQKKAEDDKPCGPISELGRNMAGGVITGGAIGFALGEGVGAIPGAIIGAGYGAYLWHEDKEKCIQDKVQRAADGDKK